MVLLATASLSCAQAPGNQSDVDWLIDALDIKSGSVVADIGAGDGEQTLAIAQHIGSEGTIYSTELGTELVKELKIPGSYIVPSPGLFPERDFILSQAVRI